MKGMKRGSLIARRKIQRAPLRNQREADAAAKTKTRKAERTYSQKIAALRVDLAKLDERLSECFCGFPGQAGRSSTVCRRKCS